MTTSTQTVYFHEDSYCQIELIPETAVVESSKEMEQIANFSAAHWDGQAWTDIYVREDLAQYMLALGLPLERLHQVVSQFLAPCDEVYTGYGSYRELCERTRAWRDPGGFCLFASFTDASVVESLWLTWGRPKEANCDLWTEVLRALNELGAFILADWSDSILIRCSDGNAISSYFRGNQSDDEE